MNALLFGHAASLEQRYTDGVILGPESFQMIENKTPLILCVDDEVVGLRVRKILLERAGYRVLTAEDGRSGIDLFASEPVDAVVLDYAMPGMHGGEVANVATTLCGHGAKRQFPSACGSTCLVSTM